MPIRQQLVTVGIEVRVERETLGFDFDMFAAAWDALAGVTTAHLPPERQQEAQAAVMATMYPHGDGLRHFRNTTQFILGRVGCTAAPNTGIEPTPYSLRVPARGL